MQTKIKVTQQNLALLVSVSKDLPYTETAIELSLNF